MIRLIDITFHANAEYADTSALLKAQKASLLYIDYLKEKIQVDVIKHLNNPDTIITEKEGFHFFRAKNLPGFLSSETIAHLKKIKPDIVLVHGLGFPLHVIRLRMILGKHVKIIVRHHADYPSKGIKKIFQKLADFYTDKYLFTSYGNAKEWIQSGIINMPEKIFELPATLTAFPKLDKLYCKQKLGFTDGLHYLWTGRLNDNKDPLTVLKGFEKLVAINPEARLHFVYQSEERLPEMKVFIKKHPALNAAVLLEGHIPNDELPAWYNAADFFVSGSHREAGSAGLLEAMACGCIPIVTSIAPAMKVICDGEYGYYFEPGNAEDLASVFISSANRYNEAFALKVESYFQMEYSLKVVTEKLYQLCLELTDK